MWETSILVQRPFYRHPRPQSNFIKIALEPHDFARNVYLIWFVNCKTVEINLCNAVNFS